jgi:hypothetical protein
MLARGVTNGVFAVASVAALVACGNGSSAEPIAEPASVSGDEDVVITGQLRGSGRRALDVLTFKVSSRPSHGALHVDPKLGLFTYLPHADYNGPDDFYFTVHDGRAGSKPAKVSVLLFAVNDPPELMDIPPRSNAADEYPTRVPVELRDVDGDVNSWSASIADESVATLSFDTQSRTLYLRPRKIGSTTVAVQASDGTFTSGDQFEFEVLEKTTRRNVVTASPEAVSLEIVNHAEVDVRFQLDINDQLLSGSIEDAIERIRRLPELRPGEDPVFKIFRSVASHTKRGYTLTENAWVHEPLTLINSIGFGYCDDVASAFGHLVRAAGYEVRIWSLGGHVVPEVLLDGRWQMLDPDIGVYYADEHGTVLGVEELATRPDRITDPAQRMDEVLKAEATAYSEELAQIYASVDDNIIWDYYTIPVEPTRFEFVLPSAGRVLIGGIWAPLPRDLVTGQEVAIAAQLRLELPAGWSGDLPSALVMIAAEGSGLVSAAGKEYAIGSPDLETLLHDFEFSRRHTRVIRSDTPLILTFLISPGAAAHDTENIVEIRSFNSGALSTALVELDETNRLRESP